MHSRRYTEYLQSPQWKAKRIAFIARANHQCQICGASEKDVRLQIHHPNYDRLGRERYEDIVVVCVKCHPELDRIREEETRRRQWDARVDGWANKVHGEEWGAYGNASYVEEEFERWLERKGGY